MGTHREPPPRDPWEGVSPHKSGYQIPTLIKSAIRQEYASGKTRLFLQMKYSLRQTTVRKILFYNTPKTFRKGRTGPRFLLSNAEIERIKIYCAESWGHRILEYKALREALGLSCTPEYLGHRLNQRGFWRCVACQKPLLTLAQVQGRWDWALAHLLWVVEWLHILWSDEVTFLVGARAKKVRVSRSKEEGRYCLNCIQHQVYRPSTIPVNAWGAIGYNYKSPLIFIHGTGKNGAFKQVDYLAQVLSTWVIGILTAFGKVTHSLPIPVFPLFMEDGNSAHGHKSTSNPCQRFRDFWHILLLEHPSFSPDMNPIEKVWRRLRRQMDARPKVPINEAEMQAALLEEWDLIPQEFINKEIKKQQYWVKVLEQRHGWSTPN